MKGEKIAKNCEYVGSNGAIRQRVQSTPAAIGYVGIGFVDNTVKALRSTASCPPPETVKNGSYPIARPLYMYTNDYPKMGSRPVPVRHPLPDQKRTGDHRGDRLRPGDQLLMPCQYNRENERTQPDHERRGQPPAAADRPHFKGLPAAGHRPVAGGRAADHPLHRPRRPAFLPAARPPRVLHQHRLVSQRPPARVRRPGHLLRQRPGDAGRHRGRRAAGHRRGRLPERRAALPPAPGGQAGHRDPGRHPLGGLRLLRPGRLRAAAAEARRLAAGRGLWLIGLPLGLLADLRGQRSWPPARSARTWSGPPA